MVVTKKGEDVRSRRGFPGGSVVKNMPANVRDVGDMGLTPGWGRSPEGLNGNPLQYSCLGLRTEEPGGLQFTGSKRDVTENAHMFQSQWHMTKKELSVTFHETMKRKIETDPSLERSMTICHVLEKMLHLYHKIRGGKQALFKLLLRFVQRSKTL